MTPEILKLIGQLIDAKIAYAIELDHGRDSTNEYLRLARVERELEAAIAPKEESE